MCAWLKNLGLTGNPPSIKIKVAVLLIGRAAAAFFYLRLLKNTQNVCKIYELQG